MKKILYAVVMITFFAFVGASWADQITITRYPGYYSGNGGEFNIAGWHGAIGPYSTMTIVNNGFETFCIEKNQYVSIPGTYTAVLSNQNSQGDIISIGTAYLYSLFATGALSVYNYTAGTARVTSAGLLQDTIWYLEGESSSLSSNVFTNLLITVFGSLENAKVDITANNNYGVRVLQLGSDAQDQLIYVPEPATLLLLGLGLVGIGILRRKQ